MEAALMEEATMADIWLRAATGRDQAAIRRIIWAARLNPAALHWSRFVVAEQRGEIVGVGQVKRHADGAAELASLAVLPGRQGGGAGSILVWTLLRRAPGLIYLRCAGHNEGFYRRFGFRTLAPSEMPPSLRRSYQSVNAVVGLFNCLGGDSERMLVMARP